MAEYNGEVIPLDNEPVGAKPYIGEVTPLKNVSTSEALGRGVESGLTAGFGDELKGLYAAGAPAESSPKQEPSTLENIANLGTTREAALLQTLKGAYNYWTGAPEAEKKYEETKAKENQAFEEAKKQNPIATMIGEVGGSIPTTMFLPGGTAATAGKLGQRMLRGAQVGAEYGAIQGAGEGEGLEGRLTGAGVGALTGGVGGAAAPAVVTGVSKLVANPLQKVVSVVKGWRFPEAEAAKRVASALAKDEADIVAGNAQGMTRSDWVKARDAGEPVTIADLGASNTQALLRSAANTSPEARNILEKVIYERFEGQSERVSRDIRQLVSGGANRFKTADQLEAEYRVAANPAYKEAYAHPNAQSMWDSTIANLARAPVVQDAIKLATKEAENEAVRVGASPIRHPFKIDQNGNLSIADPNMKTNLAFWDIVKQNLDDKVSALYRSGEKNAGNRAKDIKNDFVSHLDDLVPDYKKARGVAADYFNASNALEAGSKAANTKVVPEEISKLMRSMRPEERDLFREGYASSWSEKIMNMPYGTNVATRILPGPKERRMAEIIFGVDNIAKIETRVDLERIMNGTRAALGNSTTARQLIEAGLAGGVGAGIGYEGGGGWGAAAGAVSGAAGARHQAGKAISKGLEHAAKYVDRGTARRVAEMLVSDDPNVLGEGLRIASRNRNIAEGLKSIADRLGVIAAEKASSGIQPRTIPQITIHKEPPRATGGSVFDKMHAAKHMQEGGGLESFIKSLGSQGAAFGTQTEQEQAGFQRDPISELGKGAYNAVEHLAKENIDNANLLATGNRDQFSGKPGFEAGMLTMGTGAVAGVPMRAGEFALGSGPIKSDPKLWHGISKIKLPKPISEMNATRSPIAEIAEKQIVPSDLQGGLLLPAIGDRSIANANLHGFNGYKFEEPVPMQGGHGFMAANADKDVAWASGSPVIGRIASDVRKLNESGNPIYFPYTAMGERSVDFSHHISSTLAEALKQQPLTRNAERQFNAAMKSDAGSFGAVKNWPGVNSPYLKDYLLSSKGDVRNKFAKLMDTNNFQSLGFPNVAEARFAVTDPRLLNAPTGAAGISVSKLDPSGKILKDVSGHLTYDTDLGGKYVGGLGRSIPKEVFYPDLLSAYKKLNYEPFQYDYLMSRGVTGAPRAQKANQKWVDNVSKWIEKNPKEETKFNSGGSVFDKMKRASK